MVVGLGGIGRSQWKSVAPHERFFSKTLGKLCHSDCSNPAGTPGAYWLPGPHAFFCALGCCPAPPCRRVASPLPSPPAGSGFGLSVPCGPMHVTHCLVLKKSISDAKVRRHILVVVFIHNIPVRFVNQLKLQGLRRLHPVQMATAAVVTHQQRKKKKIVAPSQPFNFFSFILRARDR